MPIRTPAAKPALATAVFRAVAPAACLGLLAVPSAPGAMSVDLEVKESAGVASSGHPVTVAVPLPEGAAQDPEKFTLAGPDGAVPAQFSSLNRWWAKDGSIRNLLVTFLADVKAGGSAKYTLKDGGTGSSADKPLTVEDGADLVTVTTGPLRFTVSKKACKVLEQAWLDLDGNGQFADDERMLAPIPDQGGVLTKQNGTDAVPASGLAGAVVTVEEKGPVRAVVKVEVPMAPGGNPYGYKFRIYAWKGRSEVVVDYTLKNDVLGPEGQILVFDDFSLKFRPDIAAAGASLAFGLGNPLAGTLAAGASLRQTSAAQATVAGSLTGTGAASEGWMDLSDGDKGVTVAVRDFRQQFPKGLEADAGGTLSVKLWPGWGQDTSGAYVLGDMQYKTHTVGFRFHKGGEAASAPSDFARLLNARPVAVVPLAWYASTRHPAELLGYLPVTEPIAAPAFAPNTPDTLGWRNWWNNGRKYTATTGGSFYTWKADRFMLSGNPRFLYGAEAWARHSADIRPTHLSGYTHPMSKSWPGFTAGGYAWRSWRNKFVEYPAGFKWDEWHPFDSQHAWISEMEEVYLHTGDRLLYDNLANLGEIYKSSLDRFRTGSPDGEFPHPRDFAWTFNTVRTRFTLVGDTATLNLLSAAIDRYARVLQSPFSGCAQGRDHQAFMNGMIASHLSSFYRELPPGRVKSQVFGIIAGIGDYLTVHSWSQDNKGIGRMDTERPTAYYGNEEMGDILPLLYIMTGKPVYKEKAKIVAGLGAWWTDWKGARGGRLMTYMNRFPKADTVPAPAVADLQAFHTDKRADLVLLQWTVPQDAKRYDIRSSAKTLVETMATDQTADQENWWHAEAHPSGPAKDAGRRDWALVSVPAAKDRNYLVRSFDAAGDEANLSAFSNIARSKCCFDPDTLPARLIRVGRNPGRPGLEVKRSGSGREFRIRVTGLPACSESASGRQCGVSTLRLALYSPSGRMERDLTRRLDRGLALSLDAAGLPRGMHLLKLDFGAEVVERKLVVGD